MDLDDEMFDSSEETLDDDEPGRPCDSVEVGGVRLLHWRSWLVSIGPTCTLMAARPGRGRDRRPAGRPRRGSDLHCAALIEWAKTVGNPPNPRRTCNPVEPPRTVGAAARRRFHMAQSPELRVDEVGSKYACPIRRSSY